MRSTVLVLADPTAPATTRRCEAFAAFLHRLSAFGGGSLDVGETVDNDPGRGQTSGTTAATAPEASGEALHTAVAVVRARDGGGERRGALEALAEGGRLLVEGDEARYVPSRGARERVAAEDDGAWPRAVASHHRKLVRRTQGAIFRLPLETDAPVDTGGPADLAAARQDTEPAGPSRHFATAAVEVFVTDWAGMPSACGVAVHPSHPLGAALPDGERAAFTGRFCGHPLTGDLLPIWVADWVKPEFGTGAVLLNPAHDRTDLAFARQIGLPVRFSLVPTGYDGSRGQWTTPPYIRSGVAFRAGEADGLAFDQAAVSYLRTAIDRDLAEPCTDVGLGTFRIASGESQHLSGALAAVDEVVRSGSLTVVCPSALVETDLLALRLLLAEPEIEPPVKTAPEVVVVGNVVDGQEVGPDDARRLAMLVGASPLDTAALKPQQVEMCDRFLATHDALVQRPVVTGPGDEVPADIARATAQMKTHLLQREPKQAFAALYRLQKTLAKTNSIAERTMRRYQSLAHVLTGHR